MKKGLYIAIGSISTFLFFAIVVGHKLKKPLIIAERSAGTKLRFLPLSHWGFYSQNDEGKPSLLTRWGFISQVEVRDTPFDGVHDRGGYWYRVYGCCDVYTPYLDPAIPVS